MTAIQMDDYGYGKCNIKLLYVNKESPRHDASEYEIDTFLKLDNIDDHIMENNQSVIATDSQKNTVYILAKKYGIKSPEEFGVRVCQHFLTTYSQVVFAKVKMSKLPWSRMITNGSGHNHAFILNESDTAKNAEVRVAIIMQKRNEPPIVCGGIEGLNLMKTTLSGFTAFVDDEYRSLGESQDRIFRTIVSATWQYREESAPLDFDGIYNRIRKIVMESFAGHLQKGVYSPSVQRTLYKTGNLILKDIKEVNNLEMKLPNVHYLDFEFGKFPKAVTKSDLENSHCVYLPVDKPNGLIFGTFNRNSSKL